MGDSCYMQVRCARAHAHKFTEIGFRIKKEQGLLMTLVDEQARYAHCGDIPTDIPWLGFNHAGESYGASRYACDGTQLIEVFVYGQDLCVSVDNHGQVNAAELTEIRAYLELKRKLETDFEQLRKQVRPTESETTVEP